MEILVLDLLAPKSRIDLHLLDRILPCEPFCESTCNSIEDIFVSNKENEIYLIIDSLDSST